MRRVTGGTLLLRRRRAGIAQQDLAHEMGVSKQYVSKLETRKVNEPLTEAATERYQAALEALKERRRQDAHTGGMGTA